MAELTFEDVCTGTLVDADFGSWAGTDEELDAEFETGMRFLVDHGLLTRTDEGHITLAPLGQCVWRVLAAFVSPADAFALVLSMAAAEASA